eukprot:TRINITY_DN50659_c0_g1_i1.p1 TRINITY_DN50659_c0_g1~~TRINITY_DN50659_c0_g1_i1.p1  ORF type:complete len:806 (+),score=86.19 TRINITY_DN50659_c0_g1_i1:53-2470(+)
MNWLALLVLAVMTLTPAAVPEKSFKLTSGGLTLNIKVSGNDATYALLVDNTPWLKSAGFSLFMDNKWVELELVTATTEYKKRDVNGSQYDSVALSWTEKGSSRVVWETSFRAFTDPLMEQFSLVQSFPEGAKGTNISDVDNVVAAFPTWERDPADTRTVFNYLSFGGCQIQPSAPWIGRWSKMSKFSAGGDHGMPIVWYNRQLRSLMMGPQTNFIEALHSLPKQVGGNLAAGVSGQLMEIPKGFTHATLLVGARSVHAAMLSYGDVLLKQSGKKRMYPTPPDFALNHLGYWADNGAYYYRHKGPFPTFEPLFKAIKADAEQRQVPLRYFQWDDWWMYKWMTYDRGGITYWWPLEDVFPSGLTDWLGAPLSLYAPAYSSESVYMKKYRWGLAPFIRPRYDRNAFPMEEQFYVDLFANGTKAGMTMFEQDFMCYFQDFTGFMTTKVGQGAEWLHYLDMAAQKSKISLQLCMLNPNHVLYATKMMQMTNGRGTADNTRHKWPNPPIAARWNMMYSDILFYATGVWPSRDNVFTARNEPGCGWYNCTQLDPQLATTNAILCGGPYGPSDGIGYMDRDIVLRSCRTDGVLLRPDIPATAPPSTFQASFDNMDLYNISVTYSQHGNHSWHYVMGIDLEAPYSLPTTDFLGTNVGTQAWVAYQPWVTPEVFVPVSFAKPLVLPRCSPDEPTEWSAFTYWSVAPVLPSGWVLLGEPNKVVTTSHKRFEKIVEIHDEELHVSVVGAPAEVIEVWVLAPHETTINGLLIATCKFPTTCPNKVVWPTNTNMPEKFVDYNCDATIVCTPMSCGCDMK